MIIYMGSWIRVNFVLGFRALDGFGLGFRVQGLRFTVEGSGLFKEKFRGFSCKVLSGFIHIKHRHAPLWKDEAS